MKHKLMQVMLERDYDQPLCGLIQMDDAYLGGERTRCKPVRGTAAKTPFVAAMESTENGCPTSVILSVVKGFRAAEIKAWSKRPFCARDS